MTDLALTSISATEEPIETPSVPARSEVQIDIELLAAACLTIILLTLGIQLGQSGRVRLSRPVIIASVLRVGVLPFVGLPIGYAVGLRGVPLQALALSLAMPNAVNAFLLAQEYEGDVEFVAHTVTVSTVLSFLGAAIVTAFLPSIGAL